MRLLDRYILKELLIPLFFCLAGGLAFYMTFDLFSCMDDLQRNGAGFKGIMLYNLARIPELLVLILPPALLLALLYAISNHSRHNEIVAMRAAGVSVWRICMPYLLVGVLLGGALFYLNEEWVPLGGRIAKSVRKGEKFKESQVFENVNFTNVREGRTWNIGQYYPQERKMLNPSVEFIRARGGEAPAPLSIIEQKPLEGDTVKIMAESAEWKAGKWEFHQVQIFTYGSEGLDAKLPVPERVEVLTVPEVTDTPEVIESEIFISGFDSLKTARKSHLSMGEIALYLKLHQGSESQLMNRVRTLYYSRMANPFTCLVVVLVALPFSLQGGRKNVFVGVASSIVICFCFFLLNEVSLALGAGGYVSPWLSAWLPNLLFGVGGFAAVRSLA